MPELSTGFKLHVRYLASKARGLSAFSFMPRVSSHGCLPLVALPRLWDMPDRSQAVREIPKSVLRRTGSLTSLTEEKKCEVEAWAQGVEEGGHPDWTGPSKDVTPEGQYARLLRQTPVLLLVSPDTMDFLVRAAVQEVLVALRRRAPAKNHATALRKPRRYTFP